MDHRDRGPLPLCWIVHCWSRRAKADVNSEASPTGLLPALKSVDVRKEDGLRAAENAVPMEQVIKKDKRATIILKTGCRWRFCIIVLLYISFSTRFMFNEISVGRKFESVLQGVSFMYSMCYFSLLPQ